MKYLISADGRVVSSDSPNCPAFYQWIESADETIEINKASYKNGVFIKDSDLPKTDTDAALELLLKNTLVADEAEQSKRLELLEKFNQRRVK